MKFTLMSDLHLDHPQERIPYDELEEIVVIAGDTSNGLGGLKFLHKLERKGHTVFACDGNHEHYANLSQGRDYSETAERFYAEFPNLGLMTLGYPIICVNGWYEVQIEPFWRRYMNDSRLCDLSGDRVNQLARNDALTVKEALDRWKTAGLRGVVVTHTAPCMETLDPRFEGEPSNAFYWNPHLRELIRAYSDQIRVWCHGHTHSAQDKVVDGVRVVCNPRGYPGENPDWKPLTVEI